MKLLLFVTIAIFIFVAARLGELYTQLARYQRYWDYNNQLPVKKDDLTYVAFGDSAAQGVGAGKPDEGYVGLIAAELAEKSDKNVRTINLSKSGAKIADVLNTQLPKYENLNIKNQKVLTMEIGANDILSFNEQKFEKEYDELLRTLPKQTVISDVPSFSGSRLSKYESRVITANKIIYRLAQKYGFEVALLHERVKANHGLRIFSADMFHPSNHGYRTNWQPAFMPGLEKQL